MLSPTEFDEVVSGRRKDLRAVLWRAGLTAAEVPYAWAVRVRNRRFDRGQAIVERVPKPVVSVGNLTLGGTGKTPMVAWLADWFRRRGVQPAIVSRGYRASHGNLNDEALELRQRLPDVPHLQHPRRFEAATQAIAKHAAEVILLDDGFQHRRLYRDLDLVLIDAMCPFGYGHIFPRGCLREPAQGLARADFAVLTRSATLNPLQRTQLREQLGAFAPHAVWLEANHQPTALLGPSGQTKPLEQLRHGRVAAFCGIGNPAAFRATLASCGCQPQAFCVFPDHHHYRRADFTELNQTVRRQKIDLVVCTHKDLVKLQENFLECDVLAIKIEMQFCGSTTALDQALGNLLGLGKVA